MDIAGQPVDSILLSRISAEIGSVRKTMKDPVDFDAETLGDWKLMNGQSCAGTQYETDFGSSTVPDAYTEGAFFRQAKAGRTKGSFEADENKSHTHNSTHLTQLYGGDGQYDHNGVSTVVGANDFSTRTLATTAQGSESRPKNIAVNFMIKVNH